MLRHRAAFSFPTLLLLGIFLCMIGIFVLMTVYKAEPDESVTSKRYLDRGLSVEERVNDLLSQMTLREKIGQMALVEKNSIHEPGDIHRYGIGGILSGAGAKPEDNTPEGWRNMVQEFDRLSRESRLEIPILYGLDANHGHGNVPGATIFPHQIGLGATGDSALVEAVAHATAEELTATGINWSYSPTLDLPKDIRWGRVYETFSDDPELAGRLGSAYIRGLEGDTPTGAAKRVIATVKHFIGVGSMEWGTSINENFSIDQGTTEADEARLRGAYLPPFEEAVDAGVGSVMVGLNGWGDMKTAASSYLITDVLKGELGFKGFVVSDWYGVYEISDFDFYSAVIAINAGVDMIMLPFDYESFIRNVLYAVKLGLISESRIDDAVSRILYAKFSVGLFDEKEQSPLDSIGSTEHRALAREAVAKSLVLLKNENSVLPIRSSVRRINVAGSAADNIGMQAGAWTVEWQGIDGNWLPGATSILEGMKRVAPGMTFSYAEDGSFSTGTPKADLGIAVVGERPYAEGFGDSPAPVLTNEDRASIEALRASSEKVVVVLITGRPLLITGELPNWDALVVAWLPGSEGAGVADVLFGIKPFRGTLPLPWPARVEQLPLGPDQETADGTELLFERGFGITAK